MSQVSKKTIDMVQLAFFAAIIVLMASIPFLGYIPIGPIRATTIHIPVIIGSVVLGPKRGAALGFLFGLTSFLSATFQPNIASFLFTPFYHVGEIGGSAWSLLIAFGPRILVGIVPYYVYTGLKKHIKSKKTGADAAAMTVAGLAGSMTNTILVMNLVYFIFGKEYAQVQQVDFEVVYTTVILSTICINGVVEAIVAALLTTAVGQALLKVTGRTHS